MAKTFTDLDEAIQFNTTATGPGWDRLRKRLLRYRDDCVKDINEFLEPIRELHLQYAKDLCPVDTGKLRDSIHITADYSGVNEEGTSAGFHSGDVSSQGGLSVKSSVFGTFAREDSFEPGSRLHLARYYVSTFDPAAKFVEYGTSKMPARPFMRPAFDFAKQMFKAQAYSRRWYR